MQVPPDQLSCVVESLTGGGSTLGWKMSPEGWRRGGFLRSMCSSSYCGGVDGKLGVSSRLTVVVEGFRGVGSLIKKGILVVSMLGISWMIMNKQWDNVRGYINLVCLIVCN